jgi:hypothetical protein
VRANAFVELFVRHEPSAALLAAAIAIAALLISRRWPDLRAEALIDRLARGPRLFIAGYTAVLALAAVVVYHRHPLSMDEYAPLFQAQAFAAGALTGKVPPELVDRLIPGPGWNLAASADGRVISTYWPGFALLLAPFCAAGVPWLLNPLIGGATLLALHRLADRIYPGTAAAGWAVLLGAASPVLAADSISYYSMSAHLLCSLVFAALLLSQTVPAAFAAGLVGSLALLLHNPIPHAAFALPWLVWLCLLPKPVPRLAALAAGYLPGIISGLGWIAVRGSLSSHDVLAVAGGGAAAAFTFPDAAVLDARLHGLAKLVIWAVPGLVPFAAWACWKLRKQQPVALLGLSALTTLVAYFFVPFDQGHGWGYRYFHSAWGIVPLAAAGVLASERPPRQLGHFLLLCAAGSLLLGTGLRFAQMHDFIGEHLAQLPPAAASREVVFVNIERGYYTVDLVQDDPFLRNRRWLFLSHGGASDAALMARMLPDARPTLSTPVATVWTVP